MIEGNRVVAWTPFGRAETVSILFAYLWREHERGLVDEWWLCMNTDPGVQQSDVAYAYKLAARHGFIKLVDRPSDVPRLHPKQRNTGYFYRYMTDPQTVFLRFDDDIIYVEESAIERLVRHRLETQVGTTAEELAKKKEEDELELAKKRREKEEAELARLRAQKSAAGA